MRFELLEYNSPKHVEMIALRNKILREPWGLVFSDEDLAKEKDDYLLACYDADVLVGCCVLTPQSEREIQLRQMSIDADRQSQGVGTRLVSFAERVAVENDFQRLVLHARKTAVGFYEKQSYEVCGSEFIEVGMPHLEMKKELN